jgi:integrase
LRTEESHIDWIKRFILFHQMRHPAEMGAAEVEAFLSHLATARNVSASTQDQALAALLLMAKLRYETGMRIMEVVRLRIKDVDFQCRPGISGQVQENIAVS